MITVIVIVVKPASDIGVDIVGVGIVVDIVIVDIVIGVDSSLIRRRHFRHV